MTHRPSHVRRRSGLASEDPRLRGGRAINLPTPIGPIALWTTLIFFIPALTGLTFIIEPFVFVPVEFLARLEDGAILSALVPLFTHMFLHGSVQHLVLNMLWLITFGSGIARRLCVEGGSQADQSHNVIIFFAFYIMAGLAGGLTHFAFHPLETTGMVGASGAISGLMGGTLRFALRLFAPLGAEYGKLAPVHARPVVVASLLYIGLNVATGIAGATGVEAARMIAWEAHIGGFLFGLLAFPLFDRLARRPALPFGLG